MMMKSLKAEFCILSVLVFCLSFSLNFAYTGIIPPDPENPGKCVYRGDTLKPGVNSIAPCQSLTCMEDGSIKIEGCGKLRIENCNRGERVHTDKPYPECCLLKYKCKKADGSHYYIERDVSGNENGAAAAATSRKTENST